MNIIRIRLILLVAAWLMVDIFVQAALTDKTVPAYSSPDIRYGRLRLTAPAIAENGSVVPIGINVGPLGDSVFVRKLVLYVGYLDKPIATYSFTGARQLSSMRMRIRLRRTTTVYAVVTLSNGLKLGARREVKVTIGGCGAGPAYGFRTTPSYVARSTEKYQKLNANSVTSTRVQPVSTFSIDVDTGSYANIRRFLSAQGRLPVVDAVRTEEMINYFDYDYPGPKTVDAPFAVTTEVSRTPWNKHTHLLHIGIKAYRQDKRNLPASNLVFLIDVSGSMHSANKLPLLKSALKMLVNQLSAKDRVSIVVYAGASGVVLPPVAGDNKAKIIDALDRLSAGGSTNGGQGIRLAYRLAREHFIKGGINRVILATDGDFNVGTVNHDALVRLVQKESRSGIALTTLGFGRGNYNDRLMEQIADKGNGHYAYIDNAKEAYKVLVRQVSGTLFTIARDVKLQVEFNPAVVAEYRLIGYENRLLRREDFNNDKVDAGDIGAGHSVTAIYEIALSGSKGRLLSPLRYGKMARDSGHPGDTHSSELAFVKIRYKRPGQKNSRMMSKAVEVSDIRQNIDAASDDYRFSAAVAAFGQLLRRSRYLNGFSYKEIIALAEGSIGRDRHGYRREFINLVKIAKSLDPR